MAAVTEHLFQRKVVEMLTGGHLVVVATEAVTNHFVMVHILRQDRGKGDRVLVARVALWLHQDMVLRAPNS